MYQGHDMGAYRLYLIPTERFKRNTIVFQFRTLAKKEEISGLLFLLNLLFEGSKKYPSGRSLKIASNNLYGIGWAWNGYLSGNHLLCTIEFNFLDEKYTEEGMFQESLDFIFELLFHPNVVDGSFDPEMVEFIRARMFEVIESERENPSSYALQRMLQCMDSDSPISYSTIGYLEDYQRLTGKELYELYLRVLDTFDLSIFVCGRTNEFDYQKEIDKRMLVHKKREKLTSSIIEHESYREEAQIVTETEKNNQSQLFIGCKMDTLSLFERQYVSHVYRYILGGSSESYLFTNVREKNSLCYNIGASFRLISNLMIIHAGIDAEQFKPAYEIIKEQMKRILDGDIEEEQIKNAITVYLEAKNELTDSVGGLISNVSNHIEYGYDLLEEQKKNILKVTKEDVINFAKKIHMDTVYLLEGEE